MNTDPGKGHTYCHTYSHTDIQTERHCHTAIHIFIQTLLTQTHTDKQHGHTDKRNTVTDTDRQTYTCSHTHRHIDKYTVSPAVCVAITQNVWRYRAVSWVRPVVTIKDDIYVLNKLFQAGGPFWPRSWTTSLVPYGSILFHTY